MVKFAEAEKRGRGGEGSDRRYTPVVMVERAKMNRAMWESLKAHIIRDRKRKKEEQEADAEEERLRKERENRKKQQAMTLEETREKLTQMEHELTDLKNQKHQLFQDLKVVLNEDATRKRAQQMQNYQKESEVIVHSYPHGTIPIGGHPQMLFQSTLVPGRGSLPLHGYKVPPSQPQGLLPSSSLKRSRTPTPPPQPGYQPIPYNFKNLPSHPPPSVPVTVPTTKGGSGGGVYVTGQPPPYYHGSSQAHGSSTQYQAGSQGVAYLPPAAPTHTNPPAQAQPQQPPTREDKHMQPVYMQGTRGNHATHVSALHQPMDHHKSKAATNSFMPSSEGGQEKYFQPNVRSHLALPVTRVLPVQQPHPGGGKGGSITSGYPVRSAPPPSVTQPPHTAASSASHVSKPDAKPRSYNTQPSNYPRTFF